MSKFRLIPYAVLAAGLLASAGAYAQSMSTIDGREENQQQRIRDGIRDGSLTRPEATRLERGEQRIERAEQRARADGVVTPGERRRLDGMLDRESRAITHERNDGQRRDGWGGQQHGWNQGGWNRDHNGWQANRGMEHRDFNQQNRIYEGVRNGQINRGEYNRLERGEQRINRAESVARRDGVVTPGERNHIANMQNRESGAIHGARHNTPTATTPATGTAPRQAWTGNRASTGTRTAATGSTGTHSFGGAGRHR